MSHKCPSILHDKRGRLRAHLASVSAELGSGHVIPEHFHPEDQLVFAAQGVMTVSTRQGIWVVPPLRAVWIPARTPHSITMSGRVSLRTLYFLPGLVRGRNSGCSVMNVSPLLKELVLYACDFSRLQKGVPRQQRIIGMILDQLGTASSVALQLPQPSDPRAARIVQALLAHPTEEKTLDQHCRECGASKRTIQRLFLAETRMTFAKWRQQLRLLHAMQCLASGETVAGSAFAAGYGSTSAFISMFRKQLGTTPMRYFKNSN